jgi:N-acetylglucosamine transport system substrate-binding protein
MSRAISHCILPTYVQSVYNTIMFRYVFSIFLSFSIILVLAFYSDAIHRINDTAQEIKVVEVAIFKGAFGIEWHQQMAEQFNRENKHRNIKIELWGDPKLANILKPRLLRGNPPDLILDERLPLWLLIAADKLLPLNAPLAEPALGFEQQKWADRYSPGMLNMFKSNGNVYAVPAAFGAWTCWYNASLYKAKGWEIPKTWDEYIDLCEKIKQSGMVPIALQGKNSYFYAWSTYITLVQRIGGVEAINRINALEPNSFSHPDALKAAQVFQNLVANYYQPGALAMTHTEAQLQFIQGNTAMIFCGVWLENEMRETIPADFELRSFDIPGSPEWKGNDKMVHGQGMEFLFVPKAAKHPGIAFEFARYLVSPQHAPGMSRSIGAISPLREVNSPENFSPAIASVVDIVNDSSGAFNVRPYMLFPAWKSQVMDAAIQDLCRGTLTPEEFARTLDDGIAHEVATAERAIPDAVLLNPSDYGDLHAH